MGSEVGGRGFEPLGDGRNEGRTTPGQREEPWREGWPATARKIVGTRSGLNLNWRNVREVKEFQRFPVELAGQLHRAGKPECGLFRSVTPRGPRWRCTKPTDPYEPKQGEEPDGDAIEKRQPFHDGWMLRSRWGIERSFEDNDYYETRVTDCQAPVRLRNLDPAAHTLCVPSTGQLVPRSRSAKGGGSDLVSRKEGFVRIASSRGCRAWASRLASGNLKSLSTKSDDLDPPARTVWPWPS